MPAIAHFASANYDQNLPHVCLLWTTPLGENTEVSARQPTITIGRDESCTIRLPAAAHDVQCVILTGAGGCVARRWQGQLRVNGNPANDTWLSDGDLLEVEGHSIPFLASDSGEAPGDPSATLVVADKRVAETHSPGKPCEDFPHGAKPEPCDTLAIPDIPQFGADPAEASADRNPDKGPQMDDIRPSQTVCLGQVDIRPAPKPDGKPPDGEPDLAMTQPAILPAKTPESGPAEPPRENAGHTEAAEPDTVPPTSTSELTTEELDAVEQYMARLLRRVNSDLSCEPVPPPASGTEPDPPSGKNVSGAKQPDAASHKKPEPADENSAGNTGPVQINLGSLRSVANETARSAIEFHDTRQRRTQATRDGFIALCLSLVAVTLTIWSDERFFYARIVAVGCWGLGIYFLYGCLSKLGIRPVWHCIRSVSYQAGLFKSAGRALLQNITALGRLPDRNAEEYW